LSGFRALTMTGAPSAAAGAIVAGMHDERLVPVARS